MTSFRSPFPMQSSSSRGITLIELLLIVGILAILAAIIIVAFNPTQQVATARDSQRKSDVSTILNAVYQYAIEHEGALPGNISETPKEICRTRILPEPCLADNGVNLRDVAASYVKTVPRDPLTPDTGTGTYYVISKDANGIVTVLAWATENESEDISLSR